jgi:hypothetical protein
LLEKLLDVTPIPYSPEHGIEIMHPLLDSGFTQDKRGWLQSHSYSSGLAKTILVTGSPTIIVCKTASFSLERGPFVSIQGSFKQE